MPGAAEPVAVRLLYATAGSYADGDSHGNGHRHPDLGADAQRNVYGHSDAHTHGYRYGY